MNDQWAGTRVLVVDDEPALCSLLKDRLNRAGFDCREVSSGEEAIQLLSQAPFDAVISDLDMPGVSGFAVLGATRRHLPHAAFLMATGVTDISTGISAMKEGAADYLVKPFQFEAVWASLTRALVTKRMEAELEEYRKNLEDMVGQRTSQLEAAMRRIESTYDETLEALAAALDLRDNDTAGHAHRVTLNSLEMAKVLNFPDGELKQLERGAYLHDIGKIGIPDSILLKPGRLTPRETAIMQSHVRIGYELMSRVAFLAPASQIVLAHQEYFDGTGYPQGLRGEEIPLGARIFAVSDTLDAVMSDRPYRRGRPYGAARDEIVRESGRQFDPKVVAAFLAVPEESWLQIREEANRLHSNRGRSHGEVRAPRAESMGTLAG